MTPEGRQDLAAVIAKMRQIALVAGQCSVEGYGHTALMAAAEAERLTKWADRLALLLAEAPQVEEKTWCETCRDVHAPNMPHVGAIDVGCECDPDPTTEVHFDWCSKALLETRGVPQEENQEKETDTRVVDSQYDPPSAGPLATAASIEPDPTFDLRAHLQHQRDWSARTFGPGARTAGVVDHIRKELREIEADPTDISEWIDVVILGLDGAWRAGFTPEDIIAALQAKQAKNEARSWPDWRTMSADVAIEHDRAVEWPCTFSHHDHASRDEAVACARARR